MLLLWKGEIFGGIDIASDENDGEVLMRLLGGCKGSVPNALSRIKGPWAIIYWQVTLSGKFQFSVTGICCTVVLLGILFMNSICYACLGKFKKTMVWPRCIWS